MAANHRCRWVRPRLALLADAADARDLSWDDRRTVERHLIGCPSCRSERDSLASAVVVLREAGGSSPVEAGAPSIWPALARQIRGSRHVRPNPWQYLGFGPSLGLAAGLMVAGVGIGLVGSRIPPPSVPRPRVARRVEATPLPRPALPEGTAQVAGEPQVPPRPEVRVDLEKPGSANRDPQRAIGQ